MSGRPEKDFADIEILRTGQRVLLYGMLYYGVSNRKAQREAYLRAHQAKIAGKPRVQIVV